MEPIAPNKTANEKAPWLFSHTALTTLRGTPLTGLGITSNIMEEYNLVRPRLPNNHISSALPSAGPQLHHLLLRTPVQRRQVLRPASRDQPFPPRCRPLRRPRSRPRGPRLAREEEPRLVCSSAARLSPRALPPPRGVLLLRSLPRQLSES